MSKLNTFIQLINQELLNNKINYYTNSIILSSIFVKLGFLSIKDKERYTEKTIAKLSAYLQAIFVILSQSDTNIYNIINSLKNEYLVIYSMQNVSKKGIGNGLSLILAKNKFRKLLNYGLIKNLMSGLIIILFELSQRRIPIEYARRQASETVVGEKYFPINFNKIGAISHILISDNKLLTSISVAFLSSFFGQKTFFNGKNIAENLRKEVLLFQGKDQGMQQLII